MSFSLWFTFFRLFLGDSYGCTRQEILLFLQRLCLPAERFVNVLQGAPILNVILITCSDEPDLFKIPEQGSHEPVLASLPIQPAGFRYKMPSGGRVR
jgi:hypothetical protein